MIDEEIWGEEEKPWLENDGFVQTLIDKVNFLDILDRYKLEYQKTGSSNSSHKLRCPFPAHLYGAERTPSLHISVDNNLFKCFGCQAGGTIIDFVMLYKGMPKYRAIEEVAKIAGLTDLNIDIDCINNVILHKNPEHTILVQVYKASILIRDFLSKIQDKRQYEILEKHSQKWFRRLDHYLIELEDDQWEVVQKYYNKINDFLYK